MKMIRALNSQLLVWGGERSCKEYVSLQAERESLVRADKVGLSDNGILNLLDTFAFGYVTRRMYAAPVTSFRARRLEAGLFTNIADLVSPPAENVKIGRFNRVNERTRYFASDPHTALMELRPSPRSRFVLLVTKYKNQQKATTFAQFGIQRIFQTPAVLRSAYGNNLEGLANESNLRRYVEQHRMLSVLECPRQTI